MSDRSGDWLRQAEADLEHAELSVEGGDYEWACFAAQQAAERALDKQYIPARYPNGFAQGAPLDYFTQADAREAISHAKSILEFCRSQVRRS